MNIAIPTDDIYRTPEEAEQAIDALIVKLNLEPHEYTNRRIQIQDGWHIGWITVIR